jgi:uncharacterized protein YndB with AHSA1/START domain
MAENKTATNQYELVIIRTFDAPRNQVFQAWTETEHLKKWWGPKGFTMDIKKLDLQPGGIFHYSQKSPEGHEMWGRMIYQEITAPEKLVFINGFSNEDGDAVRAPFSATWPLEFQNTLLFEEGDGKTTLTMKGMPINATEEELKTFGEAHEMVKQGFNGTFDQLDEHLAQL